MKYYPIFLDMKDRDCLVVGGGPVGVRKALGLAECDAKVTMVSDTFPEEFDAEKSGILCVKKKYETTDTEGKFFVFAATDNADLNQQIKKDAMDKNILCNVADAPDSSDFLLPSIINRGDLILAVSTSGASPAMAKTIKKELAEKFGPEYEMFLVLMANVRKRLLAENHAPDEHKKIFYSLIGKDILQLIKSDNKMEINSILGDVLGEKYNFQDLVSTKEK